MSTSGLSRMVFGFAILVCAFWTINAHPQTGDPVLDGYFVNFPQKGGNNAPTSNLWFNSYSEWHDCNDPGIAPSWEDQCPSDLTYTPGTNGAYQAFGAGNEPVPGGPIWQIYCYWAWQYDPWQDTWSYYPVCDYYYVGEAEDYTWGTVAGQIQFAYQTVYTEAGSETLSTLAFTSAQTHYSTARDCYPTLGIGSLWQAAPCHGSRVDAYVVPYSGGYGVAFEDKVLIQNPDCPSWRQRDDGPNDPNWGCFAARDSSWWTDLPAPYKDTTAYDWGSDYDPGVGSSQPDQIQPGHVYGWWRSYWAWGLRNAYGLMRHISGVTQYVDSYPCDAQTPTLCQFQVDQVNIAPASSVN